MLECWEIKQGMIFYVDDVTSEESTIFKGEHTAKKRRPWLVVSNDKNNMFSPQVSMVPIYTRAETKLPTQVYFKHGNRDQVICCEDVTCIPKSMVDIRGYVGTVSSSILKKVIDCLHIQFSTTICPEEDVVSTLLEDKLKSLNIENIIASKLYEIMVAGFMGVRSTTSSETVTAEDIKEPCDIADTPTPTDLPVPDVSDVPKKPSEPKKSRSTGKRRAYGRRMTLNECLDFYTDSRNMTVSELYEKWKEYGIRKSKTDISKKRSSIKRRLMQHGYTV